MFDVIACEGFVLTVHAAPRRPTTDRLLNPDFEDLADPQERRFAQLEVD